MAHVYLFSHTLSGSGCRHEDSSPHNEDQHRGPFQPDKHKKKTILKKQKVETSKYQQYQEDTVPS